MERSIQPSRPIQRLPEEVVGKIAAGEVVESPAAAIKELIENSIDAGATAITVETREGGIAYFRVSDNGCGIPSADIRMAFERHATSKIRSADDLFDVRSLGFRGEALASIAAVAKVVLVTRTAGEDRGVKAENIGGMLHAPEDAPSPEGTTITVRELFFNTPARLKFLKKPSTEGARVADMVLRMLLSHPGVSFRLIQNDKQVYHSPGDGKLRSAIFSIYGRETTEQMLPIDGEECGMMVSGFVGVGTTARGNRTHQSFFINGRYVRSALLTKALEEACRQRVMIGQFPICVLHLRLPATLVDVNVHPNKLEVRFSDEPLICGIVERIVREALTPGERMTDNAIADAPKIAWHPAEPAPVRPAATIHAQENAPLPPRFAEVVQDFFSTMPAPPVRVRETAHAPQTPAAPPVFATYPSAPVSPVIQPPVPSPQPRSAPETEPELEPFRVLGTAFRTYILVEQGDQLLLIDQHAAHERLRYEHLMRSLDEGQGAQQLLVAQVVQINATERERLTAYADAVRGAGFEFDFFGEDAVQIRAVPMILGEPEARQSFLSVLDHLGELKLLATQEKRREAIIQMSCKGAVKGGDDLQPAEIEALLLDMRRSEAPPTCPHGRPLVVVLTKHELEKRFRRVL